MSTGEDRKVTITHVDHIGPYLKISAQEASSSVKSIDAKIRQLLPTCFVIGSDWSLERQQALLLPGVFCIYKMLKDADLADFTFLRSRIINSTIDDKQQSNAKLMKLRVQVEIIDYGYTMTVDSHELLFPKQPALLDTPQLCSSYILLGICAEWNQSELNQVSSLIKGETLDIKVKYELCKQKFITMNWKEFDFAQFLMQQKKIGARIDNNLLFDHFEKIFKEQPQLNKSFNSTLNNNYQYKNNNITLNDKTAREVAIQQFLAERSLSARLEKVKQQTTSTIFGAVTRFPPPLAEINNDVPNPVDTTNMPLTSSPTNYFHQQQPDLNNRLVVKSLKNETTPQQFTKPNEVDLRLSQQQSLPNNNYTDYMQPHQLMELENINPILQPSPLQYKSSPLFTFKSRILTVGQTYNVKVSYVENGPYAFSVQLNELEADLITMMENLEDIVPTPLNFKPSIGKACLARYSGDNNLYRALISTLYLNSCRVFYVDYGYSEIVAYQDVYAIPPIFLEAKPYSMRFTLTGLQQFEPISDNVKKVFKDYVLLNNFQLTVMPLESAPLVQYCQLVRNGANVIDILREKKLSHLMYPDAEPLKNNDLVEIRYIDSPKNFYVQKSSNFEMFEKLMDEMFVYYNKNQVVPSELYLGAPCMVKDESEWYRAEIIQTDNPIIVRHIDFGYEYHVTKDKLAIIEESHVKMPRQAVQCCLKGFENNDLHKGLATDQFEMLAEESNLARRRLFTVTVFSIEPNGVNIVNLCTKNLNVMKKLYKLSIPFNQYLTLEKVEFNNSSINDKSSKTPSSNVSNDSNNLKSNKKIILNSTPLENDERKQNEQQQQQIQQKNNQRDNNQNDKNKCDKFNSENSNNNRDITSNSNTSEKASVLRKLTYPLLDQSFDKLSISSGSSNKSFNTYYRNTEIPPRFRNIKNESTYKTRYNKPQSSRKSELQQSPQRNKRAQNSPQNYSQKVSPQKSSLNSSVLSKTSDSDSVLLSSFEQEKFQTDVYMPLSESFPVENIKVFPTHEEISICWWISPYQFYVQLKSKVAKYEEMVRDMQNFYKEKPHAHLALKVGSNVIARYRKDNIILRARILACNQMLRKYKLLFVDIGNQYTVTSEDIWQVEQRFATLPCMAFRCTFEGIISNYDHLYIVDHMDKYLPCNAKIDCDFLKINKEIYTVNVLVNGSSLKQTLINAQFITEVPPETQIALLGGQQIRAKFTNIKDMLNFKINLECHDKQIELLCAFDDSDYVKSNPDVAKQFKDFYMGKSCVFNIKDVNDNNVILLRPMMPLLKNDIPTNICTYPILLSHFEAHIIYVASPYRFYVQPKAVLKNMNWLLNEMYDYYKERGEALTKFEKDQICAARSNDKNWYRGRLISADTSKQITVYYIDYGNTEILDSTALKKLEKKFYLYNSAYGIEINLPVEQMADTSAIMANITDLLIGQIVIVEPIHFIGNHMIANVKMGDNKSLIDLLKSKELIKSRDYDYMCKVLEKEPANMLEYIETVDLTLEDEEDEKNHKNSTNFSSEYKKQNNELFANMMANIEKKIHSNIQKIEEKPSQIKSKTDVVIDKPITTTVFAKVTTNTSAKTPTMKTIPDAVLPIDRFAKMEKGVLSHCDNPEQFFLHPFAIVDQLQNLQNNLQIISPSLKNLTSISKGMTCVTLYSVDKQWYRAEIIDSELMAIKFIDFGNTDCISDATPIKEMAYEDYLPFCIPCGLLICPNGRSDWSDAANNIFNDSHNKLLYYEYVVKGDHQNLNYINLYIDGVNVADRLVADGFAKPLQYVKNGENCFISHVNNVSDFYIQFEKDSKGLELMEMYINNSIEKLEPLKHFEESLIVAALFEDDQSWYRAKLLRQVPSKGYEVMFIDYGNRTISSDCRLLPENIQKLPILSKKCELELPESCLAWSDAADEKFAEIAATGETIFTVEMSKPLLDHVIVRLLIDDHNIEKDLVPLCVQKQNLSNNVTTVANIKQFLVDSMENHGIDVVVSHVNSPTDFYVQYTKDDDYLSHIIELLSSRPLIAPTKSPEIGAMCVGKYEGLLHRVIILEAFPKISLNEDVQTQKFNVIYIDYGYEATITEIYQLPPELLEYPALAHHCRLEFYASYLKYPKLAYDTFNALLSSCKYTLKMDIIEDKKSTNLVKLYTSGQEKQSISRKLHDLLENAIGNNSIKQDQCKISHVNSPYSFYIQLIRHSTDLDFIYKKLDKALIREMPSLESVTADITCVCYSQEDDLYYRCIVKKILKQNHSYEVFLVDHGNVIISEELRQLPAILTGLPCLAQQCQLNAIPDNVEESKLNEAFNALINANFGKVYEVAYFNKKKYPESNIIQLTIDYKDLAVELAKAVECDIKQTPVPELYDCILVQFNSCKSFYLQLKHNIPKLDQITEQLNDYIEELPILTKLEVGEICAAQFTDDEAYYRAEIVHVLDDGKCEVNFIDFGNNCITNKFRRLPSDLQKEERYSMHCQFDDLTVGKFTNQQLRTFFNSKCAETFKVELLSDIEPYIVKLYYQNKNLADGFWLES